MKRIKFLVFLTFLTLPASLVFSGATAISTPDGVTFQINNTGSYSASQVANGLVNNSTTYTYFGPGIQGNIPLSVTAINMSTVSAVNPTRYLIGNSSNIRVSNSTSGASFFLLGNNVTFTANAISVVDFIAINSGASASISNLIGIAGGLVMRGGTLDQRNFSSPLQINGGTFSIQNASLIFPLSQGGQVQNYINCINGARPLDANQSFSVIFSNPSNVALMEGQTYRIIQGADGTQLPSSALTSIFVMDASGQIIPVTSFNYRPIVDANGNCEVQFSVNPKIYNGQNYRQTTTASTYTHQYIQTIASSALSVAREGGGNSYSGPMGSFTSNPFKAPNMTDFMSVTEGAQAHGTREDLQRWAPLRTAKTGIWAQPFGMILREATQQGQRGFNSRTAGILFGLDHKLHYDLIVGGALGYATTKEYLHQNPGKNFVHDRFIDLFISWFRDAWYLEGSLLLGYEHYNQARNLGNNVFASNHHAGFLITPHVGGGYSFMTKAGKLSAFANFDYTYCKQFGYQERGGNVNDLYVKSSLATMIRTEVGASFSQEYSITELDWKPKFALSLVNKKPIRKGNIIATNGASFEGSSASSTNVSPALYSTISYEDGWSLSAGLIGEFGVRYNMGEAFLKFTKKLGGTPHN